MPKTPNEHPWDEENLRRQRRCVCCGEPLTVQWPGSRCSDMAGCRDRLDALHRTALRCWRGAEYELAAIRAAQAEARAEERARCAGIILDLIEGYRGGQSPPAVLLRAERRILEEHDPKPGPAGEEG